MGDDIQVITKSRLALYNECQRKHHLSYNLGVRPVEVREDAAFGNLVHAGLDAWWGSWKDGTEMVAATNALQAMVAYRKEHPGGIDDATVVRAEVLMLAYDARWRAAMDEWEVVGVEVEFVAVIPGRKRLRVAGKLDKVLRRRADGSYWFGEHKTSGADLSEGSTYWQRLRMDPQVSIYTNGGKALGYDFHGCLYDVLVRPDQRPLKATPEALRKYTQEKPATKTKPAEPSRLYANQRDRDETLEEFRERVGAAVAKNPEAYFARAEVVRLESELEASAADVEETAVQIRTGSRTGVAPRNPGGCFSYGRTCEYLSLCDGTSSIDDPVRWRRVISPHEELGSPVV